ncbi:TIGR03016 family PEP-CTERM system-associated outer membrane protein [Methylomonas sp. LWB]|uniref:TIGR03016 family PEP-CTERM system-associated outer membrane protein n=1 Tax=Methylomonas sp. LWB TaxID=1905845 RepID=UPI0009F1CFB8|nr:TIGR03016 family PEP-CTERM system-associated outer membrane protein [Methylomonas sp. LWB]
MDSSKAHCFNRLRLRYIAFLVCISIFHSRYVVALEWRATPSMSISEIFSDNLNLSENAKKSGFVTDISPGISLFGSSALSSFNLNYRLQGLYNAQGSDSVDFNHQLQMSSRYQIIRNRLFVETSSSISQQNISNAFVATDNISGNGSRTEAKNFNISPYWTPRFGRFANGLFKVGYSRSSFDNGDSALVSPLVQNLISDSDSFFKEARLTSGSEFSSVTWGMNYSSREQNRNSGQDVRFEEYSGNARYYFNRKFNVFGQAGFSDNSYRTLAANSINNGFFYTIGGRWSPSLWYSLEVGVGNNKHVTMTFNPSSNFSSAITYRNKDVGLNTGSSWDANLNYRVQRFSLGFSYSQDTTTLQQLLVEQGFFLRDASGNLTGVTDLQDLISQGFLALDGSGNVIKGPNYNNSQLVLNPFDLVDDVIVRKRASVNLAYQTGKSRFNATAFNERRSYELRVGEDSAYGISGGWQWSFVPRLSFYLQPSWQHSVGSAASNTRYDVALGLTRSVPINLGRPLLMNTKLEFRHIEQNSDSSFGFDYTENRATANFAVRF